VKGGRCEACEGDGVRKVEMHFLADVYVTCEVCKGKRYNEATLRVQWKGKSIADVLETSVSDARVLFPHQKALTHILDTLEDVGLGYITWGSRPPRCRAARRSGSSCRASWPSGTRSDAVPAGRAHHRPALRGRAPLAGGAGRLVDGGNTVLVIEHNLDVIKTADHVIDLGPEGGARGGEIIATGTPEQVAAAPASFTGQFLKPLLPAARRPAAGRAAGAVASGRGLTSAARSRAMLRAMRLASRPISRRPPVSIGWKPQKVQAGVTAALAGDGQARR
jgi:excinuclease ABC subunit A